MNLVEAFALGAACVSGVVGVAIMARREVERREEQRRFERDLERWREEAHRDVGGR